MQPQPLRVLILLTSRSGEVVTREEIQKELWSDETFVALHTVMLRLTISCPFEHPACAHFTRSAYTELTSR